MTRKPYSKYYPVSSNKKVETTNEAVNESRKKTTTNSSVNSQPRMIQIKDLLNIFKVKNIEDLSAAIEAQKKEQAEELIAKRAERAKKRAEKKALDEKKAQEKIEKAINKGAAKVLKSMK